MLTGIQGASFFEQQLALGLSDAGFDGRIMIIDWTTGRPWRFPQHMRDSALQREAAQRVARRIREFHLAHPVAPIHLIGYSGGAAVVLQALGKLPAGEQAIVDRAAILAAACSPHVDVASCVDRTKQGLWHLRSRFDVMILGVMTRVIGTTDGEHGFAAGCVGFSFDEAMELKHTTSHVHSRTRPRFHECQYRKNWLTQFHYGGHFGYANRVWASETLGRALGFEGHADGRQ